MKLSVLGVKRITGTAKASGNPFDMCSLFAMTPVEVMTSDKISITGHGYEVSEIALDPLCLPTFAGIKFPCVLDLNTDTRPYRGKLETYVTGHQQAKAAA